MGIHKGIPALFLLLKHTFFKVIIAIAILLDNEVL